MSSIPTVPNGGAGRYSRREALRLIACGLAAPFVPLNTLSSPGVREYVTLHLEAADALFRHYRVPAAVAIAAGGLETGWGESDLALYANNHHGIKALRDWAGALYLYEHHEVEPGGRVVYLQSYFRYYSCAKEGYLDFGRFLRSDERYDRLFDLAPTDYAGWCLGLGESGYATDPEYGMKLLEVFQTFRLDQIMPAPKLPAAGSRRVRP